MTTRVDIAYCPLTLPCPCPRLPEDGSLPPHPKPADWPVCGKEGGWHVGSTHCCDDHMRRACEEAGWSWDELLADAGRRPVDPESRE